MDSTEFIWGTFDTGFLDRRNAAARSPDSASYERIAAVAAALIANEEGRQAIHIGGQENHMPESTWKRAGRMRNVGGSW